MGRRKNRIVCWCIVVSLMAVGVSYSRITSELLNKIESRFGQMAKERVIAWQALISQKKQQEELAKLETVNSFFNRLTFRSDQQQWDKSDYWATPLEFLTRGAGDCEDFSIAKYFTLRALGVPNEKLRITYVKALNLNQAHMVLTYYPSAASEPLVLDNIDKTIKPASKRVDLLPMYSFNSESLWKAKARGRGDKVGKTKGIPRWDDLNERIKNELR